MSRRGAASSISITHGFLGSGGVVDDLAAGPPGSTVILAVNNAPRVVGY
jgi:hypothetical protein